tara:strand:+ start:119 stop:1222 length:1104 start_codon:yes stop_codon:yes gene_type:complete
MSYHYYYSLAIIIIVLSNVVKNNGNKLINTPPPPPSIKDFPFYFDVGRINQTTLKNNVPRVLLQKIFECPHPCGLLPQIRRDKKTGLKTVVNGGIPQLVNLTLHFDTMQDTFNKYIPNLNDNRMIDLDFESWSPLWYGMTHNSIMKDYVNASIALVQKEYPSWTNMTQIEAEAEKEWNIAAKSLLIKTIQFVRKIRPKLIIGLYSYPGRFYYQWENKTIADGIRKRNDELYPIWCHLDVLFPSVYQFYNSCQMGDKVKKANQNYVYNNVVEAVRIANDIPNKCNNDANNNNHNNIKRKPPPVLPYTWNRYHNNNQLVCDTDEEMYWKQSYLAGANGIVMWGYEPNGNTTFINWYENNFTNIVNSWKV